MRSAAPAAAADEANAIATNAPIGTLQLRTRVTLPPLSIGVGCYRQSITTPVRQLEEARLLAQPGGFESVRLVLEGIPPDDPIPAECPQLRVLSVERGTAALAAAPFAEDDDNARARGEELLGFDLV